MIFARVAVQAVRAIELRLAAVDIVLVGGQDIIVEVSNGIMMKNFMRVLQDNKVPHDWSISVLFQLSLIQSVRNCCPDHSRYVTIRTPL